MKLGKQMKYFSNSFPLIVLGGIMILVGFLIYWYSWEIWMIGTPIMVAGVVLLAIGFSRTVNDTAYTAYFEGKIDALTAVRTTGEKPDYTASGYSFEGNTYSKLDSSQTPRSELFIRADIYFGKKAILVETFRVNASDESVNNEKLEFPLTDVTATVETKEVISRGMRKKTSVMTIQSGDKSCSFPVKYNDVDVDNLAERINSAKVA